MSISRTITHMNRYKLVLRRPYSQSHMWSAYSREFEPEVWAVAVVFLVGAALLVYYTAKVSPLETQKITLGDAFLMTFGFFCRQGKARGLTEGKGTSTYLVCPLSQNVN